MANAAPTQGDLDRIRDETRTLLRHVCQRPPIDPATIIFVVGSSGVGKSSLIEDVTGTRGRSGGGLNAGCELARANVAGSEYFFVDTPGFDDIQTASEVLLELKHMICAFKFRARAIGLWYVVDITRRRETPIDPITTQWISAFCGADFLRHLTIITTHWAVGGPLQELQDRLEQKRQRWANLFEGGAREYNHWMAEENSGNPIQWNERGRSLLAKQLKNMLLGLHPRDHQTLFSTAPPLFIHEIRENPGQDATVAGQALQVVVQEWLRALEPGLRNRGVAPFHAPAAQPVPVPLPVAAVVAQAEAAALNAQAEAIAMPIPAAPNEQPEVVAIPMPAAPREQAEAAAIPIPAAPAQPAPNFPPQAAPIPPDAPVPEALLPPRDRPDRVPSWLDNIRWDLSLRGLSIEYVSEGVPRGRISISPFDLASVASRPGGKSKTESKAGDGTYSQPESITTGSIWGDLQKYGVKPVYMRERTPDDPFVQRMMFLDGLCGYSD